MGRVNLNDLDKYNNSKGGKFFKLADDGDTASVRFMLEDADDLNDYLFVVHKITVDGRFSYVNCLREYNDPIDVCPLCAAENKATVRMFLPLYDNATDSVKIWDRSKAFARKITGLCSRYKNLVSHTFDIVRNGEANDMQTTYDIFQTDKDDTTLEDLPLIPTIEGLAFLDKSEEDLEYFVSENAFPPEDDEEDVKPRKSSSKKPRDDEEDDEEEEYIPRRRDRERTRDRGERSERRTPAKKRSKEDKF